jgi:sulfur carrier protein
MIVKLNDKPYEVTEGTTLDRFIESLEIPLQGVAIAIDYEVIPKNNWSEKKLADGMTFMMIHAVSGG